MLTFHGLKLKIEAIEKVFYSFQTSFYDSWKAQESSGHLGWLKTSIGLKK